jgi:MFS transporter, DHA1 family, tetracycline resistance protein
LVGTILALVQGVLVGRVIRYVSEPRLVPSAIALIALGIGLVPLTRSVPELLGALSVLSIGMGLNAPALSSMVSRSSGADEQGGILGLAQSLASLGRIVGPAWGGFLFDRYGMSFPYISGAAIMFAAFLVALASLARD